MNHHYLLDTNIVMFYFLNPTDLIRKVQNILNDYNNVLSVSTTSIKEIIHLYNSGRIKTTIWETAKDIVPDIEAASFHLLPVKREHLATYATLSTPKGHNDPNDHIIISQAITERMMLISSDQKFEQYLNQGLRFIFNDR
jgi:PIN domain nuclease of toxin-antitoxin system